MNKPAIFNTVAVLLLLSGSAYSEDSTLKEGAKKVGQETGEVVRKIGEGGKEVGKKVAETAREVGHATRDGTKEFVKAVKGETDGKTSISSASSSSVSHQHKSN